MKIFKIFGLVVLFVLILLLVHPFYMSQSVYGWLYKSGWKNSVARIDIYNLDEHTISVSENGEKMELSYPEDCENIGKNCAVMKLSLSENWQTYSISFQANGAGKNKIRLRGPAEWSDDGWMPILADYKDLTVDGQKTDMSPASLWFSHFYDSPVYNVKNGEKVTFSFAVRQHHLKFNDLKLLYDTYSNWKIVSYLRLIIAAIAILIFLLLLYYGKIRQLYILFIFSFLIMPLLCFSNEKISAQENRVLNKFPSLFVNGHVNEKFGMAFNNWFSDRFGGRQNFIDMRFSLLYLINNKTANQKAFIADEGWIFPMNNITKITSIREQHDLMIKTANLLKKIDIYMMGKDVSIYVVLEPSRSFLYRKYWQNYYPYIEQIKYNKELKKELKKRKNIHLIDLYDVFEENKNKVQLYEKNDVHMTLPAMNMVIERITSALGPDFYEQYKKSIQYQDRKCVLFSFSHIYDDYLNRSSPERNDMCQEIIMKDHNIRYLENEAGYREAVVSSPYLNKDLYILFPCYEEFIFPILGEFFAHTVSVNYNPFQEYDEEHLRNKAISKLKSVRPGTVILIFLSHPTEYIISRSIDYLEAF